MVLAVVQDHMTAAMLDDRTMDFSLIWIKISLLLPSNKAAFM
jgi:hypothetical protein